MPSALCKQLYLYALDMVDLDLKDLRVINKAYKQNKLRAFEEIIEEYKDRISLETSSAMGLKQSEDVLRLSTDIFEYFNRADVRDALHVASKVPNYQEPLVFSTDSQFKYNPNFEASRWIYEIFRSYGYQMLHIMGSTDGLLSMRGIWGWLGSTGWKASKPWSPFTDPEGQLLGFTKEYDQFKLATLYG